VVLSGLREEIRFGRPIVSVEPTCYAVFNEGLGKLTPFDDDAD
jgi:hypothetical protein